MNRLFFLMLTVVTFLTVTMLTANAQQDSAIKFSKYLGVFGIDSYDAKCARTNDVTLRIGGDAVLPFFERITLNTRAGYETGPTEKGCVFGKFYFERKSSLVNIDVGYMPRPIACIMRPAPLSADGHFEPPALSAMPGTETGAYIGRKLWDNGPDAMIGAFYLAPSKSIEGNASLDQKLGSFDISIACFASRNTRSGCVVNVKAQKVSLTAFATSDSVATGLLCWEMKFFTFYANANMNSNNNSFSRLEFGIVKTFIMPYGMKMLVGAGYLQNSRTVNFYVQLYRM